LVGLHGLIGRGLRALLAEVILFPRRWPATFAWPVTVIRRLAFTTFHAEEMHPSGISTKGISTLEKRIRRVPKE
jgi:hypothetical protein